MRSSFIAIALLAACGGNKAASPPPVAPTGLSAAGGAGSITLAWTGSAGATGYVVQRGSAAGGPYSTVASPASPGFTDTGLPASTAFFYVVQARNDAGTSGNSNEATAITQATAGSAPGVPAGLTATATGTTIAISWTAGTDATGYVVSRASAAAGPYTPLATPTGTTLTDSGLSAGTTYYYKVHATNAAGASADSPEAHATTAVAAPAAPVVAAAGGSQQITLSWTAVAGVTYAVGRAGAAGGPYTQLAAATSPFVDGSLQAGATWYYVVTATNASGTATSAEVVGVTLSGAPTGLAAQPGNNAAQLGWLATPGAASYDVLIGAAAAGPFTTLATSVTALVYSATGLTNGTQSCFQIQSVNAAGHGGISVVACTVPDGRPNPVILSGTAGNATTALTWSASTAATSYQLYRAARPGTNFVKIADQTGTTFNDTATNDVTYDYFVIAHNAVGDSLGSNTVTLLPHGPLAAPVVTALGLNGKIKLSWGAVTRAGSYDVFRATTKGGPYTTSIATVTATTFVDTVPNYTDVPLNHTVYYYAVLAKSSTEASSALSAEVTTTAAREICVASDAPAIYALNADIDGEQEVRRTFGGSTRLGPSLIAIDNVNAEIYALNPNARSITVHPLAARGDVPPSRLLAGAVTGLIAPNGLFVDSTNNEMFVSNRLPNNVGNVLVFTRLANGAAAPVRTLTLDYPPTGVYVDAPNNLIYVTSNSLISVYPRTATQASQRVKYLPPTNGISIRMSSILLNNGELFVGDHNNPGSVSVFNVTDASASNNTPVAPKRTLTGLTPVTSLAFNTTSSELIVAAGAYQDIYTFPQTWSGNPAPARTANGFPIGTFPDGIAYDIVGNKVWFTGSGDRDALLGVLSPSDTAWDTSTLIGTAPALYRPYPVGLSADPVNGDLWFASNRGDFDFIAKYDLASAVTNTVQTRQIVVPGAHSVIVNLVNDEIYVSDELNPVSHVGTVSVYSRTSGAQLRTISGLAFAGQLAFHGGQLFVNDAINSKVLVYDRAANGTLSPAANAPLSGAATGINKPTGIFVDGTDIVVLNDDGSVAVLPRSWGATTNPAFTRMITQSIPYRQGAEGVIKDAGGNIYVSNTRGPGSFLITVFDPSANGAAAPIRTLKPRGAGPSADGLAFCN